MDIISPEWEPEKEINKLQCDLRVAQEIFMAKANIFLMGHCASSQLILAAVFSKDNSWIS